MFLKNIIIKIINFYRNYLSSFTLYKCRFHPSCSEYTKEAITKDGVFTGTMRGLWRILRCNPFSGGGYDPYVSLGELRKTAVNKKD